jgi:hypothetical protein
MKPALVVLSLTLVAITAFLFAIPPGLIPDFF